MTDSKDCPLCGETMRMKTREQVDYIPGQSQVVRTELKEWVCADCDFFEEYDPEIDDSSGER